MISNTQLASLLVQTGTSSTVGERADRSDLLKLAQAIYKQGVEDSAYTALGCVTALEDKDYSGYATSVVVLSIRKLGDAA